MNTDTLSPDLSRPGLWDRLRQQGAFAWLWNLLVIAGAVTAWQHYEPLMDIYEKGILIAMVPGLILLGTFWPTLRHYLLAVAALSLFALWQ